MDWSDYGQVLTRVQQGGHALHLASEELRANESIVIEAVKENGCAVEYASEDLRANECLYELYKENKKDNIIDLWSEVDKEIKENYRGEWQPLMASYYQRTE